MAFYVSYVIYYYLLIVLFCNWTLRITMGSAPSSETLRPMATSVKLSSKSRSILTGKIHALGPLDQTTVCKNSPGLTKEQIEVCNKFPDVSLVAIQSLQSAVEECEHQFSKERWNCSSLRTKNNNPHASVMLKKGYRESAFAYAINSAGVVHSVARSCSRGQLLSCGCGWPSGRRRRGKGQGLTELGRELRENSNDAVKAWKWAGCAHNIDFGLRFSRRFLDAREKAKDMHSQINLHNNHAGRQVVAKNMETRCKCHGLSGSCELKTCWQVTPSLHRVGEELKDRYNTAVLVDQSNNGKSPMTLSKKKRRKTYGQDLLYYERSPNYCDVDNQVDYAGTSGRRCNKTGTDNDSCASLCCGRGYNTRRERRIERCNCRFHWCCYVVCQNCTIEEWVTECK